MLLLLIIFNLLIKLNCLKVWKYNNDIMAKNNWKTINNNCDRIKFDLINEAPIYIDKILITNELILPKSGELDLINDGMILFEKNSKCIELKSSNYHEWSDYRNWQFINDNDNDGGDDFNDAVPHLERIPCDFDNISLPAGIHTRIKFNEYFNLIKLNSIKFNGRQLTQNEINQLLTTTKTTIFRNYYDNFHIKIDNNRADDSTVCHHNFIGCPIDDHIDDIGNENRLKCTNPIRPHLFCSEICGASIEFYQKSSKNIEKIKNLLKQFTTISTHLSHINDDNLYQIVFTENDFIGNSLIAADDFYQELKLNAHHYKINNLNLYKSGNYNLSNGKTTLILIFSTFFGVILIFAIIFYGFNPNNSILTRLRLGAINPGPFMARFDGQRLTLDGQSLSGSIVQLDRSFDNPMYSDNNGDDDDNDKDVEELH